MTYRCLIVDDEPLASNIIKRHFSEIDHYEVVATANNATAAYNILKEISIDLIILDINMPGISGIEFVRAMDQTAPEIIISTAYRDYAVEGFELDIVDYLVKPIRLGRFIKALNKFEERVQWKKEKAGKTASHADPNNDHIFLKVDKKMIRVSFDEILYIESLKDYVRVMTIAGELITHHNLSGITQLLPASLFIRIHRSFTIAHRHVKALVGNTIEIGEAKLPIGRNYLEEVKKRILGRT